MSQITQIKVKKMEANMNARTTRAITQGTLTESGSSLLIKNSCIGDATRLWNLAPAEIKISWLSSLSQK